MSLEVECPECGLRYKVKDALAGRKIRCRECSAAIVVPTADDADDWGEVAELPARRKTGKKAASRSSDNGGLSPAMKWLLGIAGAGFLGMVTCCGIGAWQVSRLGHQFIGEVKVPPGQTFAQWRAGFRTKLIQQGPAPQDYDEETPPENVAEVLYPSGDLNLKAWVYRPPEVVEPRPALVFLHGGFAFGEADLTEACAPFIEAGYVVMTPMLRGENGNPGSYELFLGEVDDARAAVKWLAAQPYVNPQRIYVFGHSVGGGVASVLPLLDDVPMRHSGSSGGLYDHATFLAWQFDDTVPFENNPMERSVRLLVGNSQFLQRPHYAYLGTDDESFHETGERLQKEAGPAGNFTLEMVPGGHFDSFEESIRRYLAVTERDGPVAAGQ